MSEIRRRDWQAVIAHLEAISQSLDEAGTPPPEKIAKVWRERAARYAAPEVIPPRQAAADQLIVFRLGSDRYALPVSLVREVLPEPRIALVPGAPSYVAGVIQVRGEILPVYHLPNADEGSSNHGAGAVVVVEMKNRRTGLLVNEVLEIRNAGTEYRKQEGQSPHIAWVTDDLVSVLDLESTAAAATGSEPQWKGES